MGVVNIAVKHPHFRFHWQPARKLLVALWFCHRAHFPKGNCYMISLSTAEKFTISVAPVTDANTPGAIDSPPTYPVDVNGVVALVPSADGLSCIVDAIAAGTCTITPTAVAGGKTITGTPVQVTVSLAPATKLLVTTSAVSPK